MTATPPSERTRVRRLPKRGGYETDLIHAILGEAPFCFVGIGTEHGPSVVPTIHARINDTLYLHGSTASRTLGAAIGAPVCVSAAILDGLVVARSAFHHSMNYRAVVAYGTGREVTGDEKERAFEAIVEHVLPGRYAEARRPDAKEIAATLIVAIPLDEASAKVRTGPPVDDDEDLDLPVWGGVVPVSLVAGTPEPDAFLRDGVALPPSVVRLARD